MVAIGEPIPIASKESEGPTAPQGGLTRSDLLRAPVIRFLKHRQSTPTPPVDPHIDAAHEARWLSRRVFLRNLMAGLLIPPGVKFTMDNLPNFLRLLDASMPVVLGENPGLDQLTSDIPPTLKLEKGETIPKKNKWFKNADVIFKEGIQEYERLRREDTTLARLNYSRPDNYLYTGEVADSILLDTINDPSGLLAGLSTLVGDVYGIAGNNDKPYSEFFNGSGSNITSINQMILIDPGTGLVKKIRETLREHKELFGDDFDLWAACKSGMLKPEQLEFLTRECRKWYKGALDYAQVERLKNGEQISTSKLFGYFLRQNKGDILASIWDTSTWLKLLVRNDPNNPNEPFKLDPNYNRAKLTTDLFRDEFSETISANWVVDHVKPDDKVLNFIGSQPDDNYKYPQYKDYMPSNRAGGLYHGWNIMALCLCMDPVIAQRMVALYEYPFPRDDGKRFTEYGKVKSIADMNVVSKANEIESAAREYKT